MTDRKASSKPRMPMSRHTVTVFYPCTYLLENTDQVLMLAPVTDSATRYEPGPLIEDDAVSLCTDLHTIGEVAFTSIYPAYFNRPIMSAAVTTDHGSSEEPQLLRDMKLITSSHGATELSVVTFQCRVGDRLLDMIRIYRRTRMITMESTEMHEQIHSETYTTQTFRFDALNTDAQWYLDMLDLIQGTSDRAVRHVALQLKERGQSDVTSTWKPSRRMPYHDVLPQVSSPIPLAELEVDEDCVICALPFDNDVRQPLAMTHEPKHRFCKSCLLDCCHDSKPEKFRCPYCRHLIFDNAAIERLKFGVRNGNTYEPDMRYDPWENAERSCADLDGMFAHLDESEVFVNSAVLMHAWESFVETARLEDPRSTPYHLQAVRSPELPQLSKLVQAAILPLDGQIWTLSDLYFALDQIIALSVERGQHAFTLAFTRYTKITETLPSGVPRRIDLPSSEALLNVGLRAGTGGFVLRILHRVLRYASLRVCYCQPTEWHWHGLREHYNPDAGVSMQWKPTERARSAPANLDRFYLQALRLPKNQDHLIYADRLHQLELAGTSTGSESI